MLILFNDPSTAAFWSEWEHITGRTFDKILSVDKLLELSTKNFNRNKALEPHEIKNVQTLFDNLINEFDDSISCFCGD